MFTGYTDRIPAEYIQGRGLTPSAGTNCAAIYKIVTLIENMSQIKDKIEIPAKQLEEDILEIVVSLKETHLIIQEWRIW